MTSERAPYVLEDQVGNLLRRAHQRATAVFLATLAGGQITPTQWAALVKLAHHGALSQNHLGRLTAMDPATIQGVTRRLEERALIERTRDQTDRRRFALTLTAEGAALVERHRDEALKVSADTLAPLTAAEQAQFLALLKKLT